MTRSDVDSATMESELEVLRREVLVYGTAYQDKLVRVIGDEKEGIGKTHGARVQELWEEDRNLHGELQGEV